MNILKLTSCIPPSVNHYLAYRAIMNNGRPQGTSYKTKEAKKYQAKFKEYVKDQVEAQNWDTDKDKYQHYYVDAFFYFPRTDMDANNYWKVLLDAITDTGLIWQDDNVVCERVQGIWYDSENPRIELEIKPVDYIGVFNNASQMEAFKSICIGCTRYKRNCSILRQAMRGNVQPYIKNGVCTKMHKRKEEL